ncbi:MAG TPA: hypothetical protein PK925_13245 [Alicycliphilus sp.]|nr:hypothetical protein [Alicycliphilus sp.]
MDGRENKPQRGPGGRPRGEVHLALLRAVQELATPERGVTVREAAAHARVGLVAARSTLSNLRRYGVLEIARTRRVPYRNRPVAEYAPPSAAPGSGDGARSIDALAAAWAGQPGAGPAL